MIQNLPRAALSEISGSAGSGKTELFLHYLASQPQTRIAWLEEDFTAYPSAFPQLGVALDRVLFAEAGRNLVWAASQSMRSRLFSFVVLVARKIAELDLRRLQLDAERSGASVVLLQDTPTVQNSWPISLQLNVVSRRIHVLKNKNKIPTDGRSLIWKIN